MAIVSSQATDLAPNQGVTEEKPGLKISNSKLHVHHVKVRTFTKCSYSTLSLFSLEVCELSRQASVSVSYVRAGPLLESVGRRGRSILSQSSHCVLKNAQQLSIEYELAGT